VPIRRAIEAELEDLLIALISLRTPHLQSALDRDSIPSVNPHPATRTASGTKAAAPRSSSTLARRTNAMTILKWALIFLAISVVAGIFGFTGISAASADLARILFYIFAVIFIVLLILGFTIFRA
jgi:uncharacterized membrane protein YtjA (UPF0391 family)